MSFPYARFRRVFAARMKEITDLKVGHYKGVLKHGQSREPMSGKQQILDCIGAIARRLGRAPSHSEFFSRAGISKYSVSQFFPRWNDAVRAWDQVRKLAQRLNDLPRQLNAVEGMARNLRLGGRDNAGALPYLHEAYRLAGKLKKMEEVGRFLNSMAIIEWELQNYDNALNHYEEALSVYRDLGDDRKVGFILNSLAVTLRSMSRFDEAVTALDRALAIHRETNERLHEGQALAVMGHLHADRNQVTEALDAYRRSLTIRLEIGDSSGQGWMMYYIALIYVGQKQIQEGRSFVSQAHEIASTSGDKELSQACLNLEDKIAVIEHTSLS